LIPMAAARAAFREFFQTGQRFPSVAWQEGCY
jgi:hypothetical protein